MDSLRGIDGPPRFRGPQPPLTETPSKSSAPRPAYQPTARFPRELLNLSVSLSVSSIRCSCRVPKWNSTACSPNCLGQLGSVCRRCPRGVLWQITDEVKTGFGLITRLTGLTWAKHDRTLPLTNAIMHKSVYERFDALEALEYDTWKPYRPETLRHHVEFARLWRRANNRLGVSWLYLYSFQIRLSCTWIWLETEALHNPQRLPYPASPAFAAFNKWHF
jgi:hypothetical protein